MPDIAAFVKVNHLFGNIRGVGVYYNLVRLKAQFGDIARRLEFPHRINLEPVDVAVLSAGKFMYELGVIPGNA